MAGFLRRFLKPGLPVLRGLGRALLGGSTPAASTGSEALPSVPEPLAAHAKIIAFALPLIVGFLDHQFNWNLTQFLGPDGGEAVYPLLAMYLGWRVPMRTKPAP